jgi:hypothetical protein
LGGDAEVTASERAALTVAVERGLPYVGLRDLDPDPNLLLYLPSAMTRAGDVVPLSREENVLELACANADTDLSPIRSRFPRLRLEVSISPADDVRTVLGAMSEKFK